METILNNHKVLTPIPQIYLVPDFITQAEESHLANKIDQVGISNEVIQPDLTISIRAGGWQNLNGRRSMYWGGTLSPKGMLIPQNPPSFMTDEWPQVFKRLEQMNIFKPSQNISSKGSYSALPTVAPNHCLVNEYNPGDGILPHTDGPAYLPTVATISLEADTVYEFYCYSDQYNQLSEKLARLRHNKNDDHVKTHDYDEVSEQRTIYALGEHGRKIESKPLFSLFVPRRSLIIIDSEGYHDLLHSIPARMSDDLFSHLRTCINWGDFSDLEHDLVDDKLPRARRLSLTCRRIEKVFKGLSNFLK